MPSRIEREITRLKAEMSVEESAMRGRMRDAYQLVIASITAELNDLMQWMEAFPEREWSIYQQQRLEQLLADAERQFEQFTRQAETILQQTVQQGASAGVDSAKQIIQAVGFEGGFRADINNTALQRLIASFGPGSPVKSVLDGYGAESSRIIQDELTKGLAQGNGARSVIKSIMDQTAGGAVEARIEALVRTEFMRSYREAQLESYRALGDVVPQWRWSCSKSRRTCLACLGIDGQVFDITIPFSRAHPNCRCVAIPVVDPSLIDMPHIETGAEWFARQPADVQRRMLPSTTAYNAYRAGKLELRHFVGERHSDVWGMSVMERSGKRAMKAAGINAADYAVAPPKRQPSKPNPDELASYTI